MAKTLPTPKKEKEATATKAEKPKVAKPAETKTVTSKAADEAKIEILKLGNVKSFEGVIGQEKAVELLSIQLQAAANGKAPKSVLLRGEAGLGKTHIATAYTDALAEMGWHVIEIECPSQIVGEKYAVICNAIREGLAPIVVRIDEAHRLKDGRVSVKRFAKFLQLATDKLNLGREISVNDGEISTPCLSWDRLHFVLSTNFPGKLEEGKGSTAFQSRFCDVLLESYNADQISKILAKMVNSRGIKVCADARKYIVSCARGTARPLDNICDKLESIAASEGVNELDKNHIMHAIKLSDLYPVGLTVSEVAMLGYVRKKPYRQNVLASMFPSLDVSGFRASLAYLQGKEFIHMGTGGYNLTPYGHDYLSKIEKMGFKVALS